MKPFFNFLMPMQARFTHTGSTCGVNYLHPNYIAGFIDGEGSFNITVSKDDSRSAGHRVVCEISLRARTLSSHSTNNSSYSGPSDLDPTIKAALIGLILGYAHLIRKKATTNTSVWFDHSIKQKGYLMHKFELLKEFCNTHPKVLERVNKRNNKSYQSIRFYTKTLGIFNEFHDMFYNSEGIKTIPLNIGELLTPIGLAYWCQDDGYKDHNGFVLCTDSFSKSEVEFLIEVLQTNFGLNGTLYKKNPIKGTYRIWIRVNSMAKFKALVTPYFHDSMLYKLQ
jgi:hypothetical protein